jgi:hypothetical protein
LDFGGTDWQFAELELVAAAAGVDWSALFAVLGKENTANDKARVATTMRMCDVQKAMVELNAESFRMRGLAPLNVTWTAPTRSPYLALRD